MIAVFPQGWAFFTRDPREPVDEAYRPGERLVPILYPNSSARNLFGFSRRARAQNVEMAALLLEVPASAWKECRAPLRRCLEVAPGCAVAVANVSVTRQICGPVVVERQPPVPWAWGRSTGRIHMPSKVVRLEVACPASG
jgi:antimicrobial peptide system SdpA family protein